MRVKGAVGGMKVKRGRDSGESETKVVELEWYLKERGKG